MDPSRLQYSLVSIIVGIATGYFSSSGCSKPTDSIDPMRVFQDQQIRVGIPANAAIRSAFEEIQSEWEFQTGAGVNAPPSVFEHDGQQYIAVYSAGNLFAGSARGDSVWLFSLNGTLGPVNAPVPVISNGRGGRGVGCLW